MLPQWFRKRRIATAPYFLGLQNAHDGIVTVEL